MPGQDGCSLRTAAVDDEFQRGGGGGGGAVLTRADNLSRRLKFHLIRHGPCNHGGWKEQMRFPDHVAAPVESASHIGEGCYTAQSNMMVHQNIYGSIQSFVETRLKAKGHLEPCISKDSQNCGGMGSCVYCHKCYPNESYNRAFLKLIINGRSAGCEKAIKKGPNNLKMIFCMPTLGEFLNVTQMDINFWNNHIARQVRIPTDRSGNIKSCFPLLLATYLTDR
ncbi:unnamed protein product [Soboliphyme baturini]|uniref:Uncharacterized protein n=1 Tax=Soboliphyme baturini TaxID=241478 RepID=A0A183IJA1_9BILA|nr:unnamed protein product [Soboliphyme baturini]